jgi:hypothetical protein
MDSTFFNSALSDLGVKHDAAGFLFVCARGAREKAWGNYELGKPNADTLTI